MLDTLLKERDALVKEYQEKVAELAKQTDSKEDFLSKKYNLLSGHIDQMEQLQEQIDLAIYQNGYQNGRKGGNLDDNR